MKTGQLWKVTVETSAEAEEAVLELLERVSGAPASSCTQVESGAVTATVFLEKRASRPPPDRAQIRAGLEEIRACGLKPDPARITIRTLPRQDWAESWKRHFKPIEVSRALVIQPSWSRRRPRPGQGVVVLDPGLSFGTGQHPTTAFCLLQLVRGRRAGQAQAFLDIGCGSGILALAAARLGYAPVEAFDFDAEAVRIARGNAAQNRVVMRCYQADVCRLPRRQARRHDLVCANLTSDLLLAQARRIIGQVRPGGLLVLAGILERQFPAVRAAYEKAGLRLERSAAAREWRSGAFRAPAGLPRTA
jgi:ribosomal protein L11 methyltransferase